MEINLHFVLASLEHDFNSVLPTAGGSVSLSVSLSTSALESRGVQRNTQMSQTVSVLKKHMVRE